jgi:hypothetical protein
VEVSKENFLSPNGRLEQDSLLALVVDEQQEKFMNGTRNFRATMMEESTETEW